MRFAICNETFQGWDWARTCLFVKEIGYDGIEIAPFTLARDIRSLTRDDRSQIRSVADKLGLTITALHWLLVSPEGLHINSSEPQIRDETTRFLESLIDLTNDLGARVMVFGSPKQRRIAEGVTKDQAEEWAEETIRQLTPRLSARNVFLALEPLPAPEADLWLTSDETWAFVERIGHPNVGLHLDVKSMCAEGNPVDVIRRFGSKALYFHANDSNRRGPGFGEVNFHPIMTELRRSGYDGWVSVEVFDDSPNPETIARKSLDTLKNAIT